MCRRLFLWSYAFFFDIISGPVERAGLTARRSELLSRAVGVTVEIGAGTGLNLSHYPAAVSSLVLVEPDPAMRRRLGRRAAGQRRRPWRKRRAGCPHDVKIIGSAAEQLPFTDGLFDTAVVTFALCSVADQQMALDEIARILAPYGRLLFLEHVRSADSRIAARQDRRPFPYALIGCHPNRDTLRQIEASPLEVESVWRDEVPRAPEIERPMIAGVARRLPSAESGDRRRPR
jgi:ubiquinone/menaquinone biosynthesis C-methylase UbiE